MQKQKNIPQGYKLTEVGVIPEDWGVTPLSELVKIYSGESPINFEFDTKGTPYFKVEQLNNNDIFAEQTEYFIKSQKYISEGSIIFPKRGASILLNKIRVLKYNSYMDTNLMTLTCNKRVNNFYLFYILNYKSLHKIADTTSIPQINNKHILPFLISLPNSQEQASIAAALSDIDALIQSIKKLINKKHAIKTATMQQLLTGKKRLSEFAYRADGTPKGTKQSELGEIPEDWSLFFLNDCINSIQLGGNYKNSENETQSPLIKMGNLNRGNINLNKLEYIQEKANEADRLQHGDVLFNTRNTLELVGKVAIWKSELPKAYFNSNIMRFNFSEKIVSSNEFMNAILNMHKTVLALSSIATGTTSVAAIYTRDLFRLKLCLPPKKEQTAIATILFDMDKEIEALQARLHKTEHIKQGMMQELLTGKTRLVTPA